MNKFKSSKKRKGHMTLPVEVGQEELVLNLVNRWNVDALRDCDGTEMPDSLLQSDRDIYSIICLVRADQSYANHHPEFLHRKYLLSERVIAFSDSMTFSPLNGYSKDKYEIDDFSDPSCWWEVRDRTTDEIIDSEQWFFDFSHDRLTIENCKKFHEYTVTFLVRQVWDSVSMYNALTNDWDGPPIKSLDPYHPSCRQHLIDYYQKWLDDHPATTVVRFTTFAYLFVIDTGEKNQDIYRDWTGYGETVSPRALNDFEQRFGYRLSPEVFVDAGYYNGTYKLPSQEYLDWMTFIQDFVVEFAAELVAMTHQAGKKSAMFQGDHWVGTEPFLAKYQDIGLDINIGAVEDGVALRRLTDSPGSQIREARFYPYFFPDVFQTSHDPVIESQGNWNKIRRAMLQKPLHRIGYGGYLSLANQFPHFIQHIEEISDQFEQYLQNSQSTESLKLPFKVAILNGWGESRSWLQNQSRDQRFYLPPRPDVMDFVGNNILECLAGLPIDVEFISFEDIRHRGIDPTIDIIINSGDANSVWSGAQLWDDSEIIIKIRQFVSQGGGFLGVTDPSAYDKGGRYFQLGDILGVEKENSLTMGRVAAPISYDKTHYLSHFVSTKSDFGNLSYVYPQADNLSIIAAQEQHLALTAREYEQGRAVYLANLPFSRDNAYLLQHILIWLAQQEYRTHPWLSNNPNVDVAYFPTTKRATAMNATPKKQVVEILDIQGIHKIIHLAPYEWIWRGEEGEL
ncbi:1,3-beta-galactosyl-N-acetylhexosamine phosphorylase [Vibrio sp. SS-MA-C1-2]|uniref:1,3-beta-galactosyl-N-acetylhexosamine phosphorylase n=1 Tax=Vibrio sp. SS-MA-C1-2 TaxID=2908646 RepID=UPI001F36E3B0|nr:1,3-beta-galactosyl-N-acetylhexosamine phosphorylase [Vibrio sp. SS-MA-C1-2]UJF18193.1 1,3-beta-galactosyl-N-acetylhexosamine phosphorylase [Vibrio sp. SS-MA-C1-2]